jgi:hypothetical protein
VLTWMENFTWDHQILPPSPNVPRTRGNATRVQIQSSCETLSLQPLFRLNKTSLSLKQAICRYQSVSATSQPLTTTPICNAPFLQHTLFHVSRLDHPLRKILAWQARTSMHESTPPVPRVKSTPPDRLMQLPGIVPGHVSTEGGPIEFSFCYQRGELANHTASICESALGFWIR